MPIQSRANIKDNFRQYERPEQEDYHNWIDSFIHKDGEDELTVDNNGNVGIGVTNPEAKLDINGAIRFSKHEEGTLMYYSTSKSGSPAGSNDGFRLRFDNDFFGPSRDGVVFEKTHTNQVDPDGGFAFVNTGNDGTPQTAMVIQGNGNIGIGANADNRARLLVNGLIETSSQGIRFPDGTLQETSAKKMGWVYSVLKALQIRKLDVLNDPLNENPGPSFYINNGKFSTAPVPSVVIGGVGVRSINGSGEFLINAPNNSRVNQIRLIGSSSDLSNVSIGFSSFHWIFLTVYYIKTIPNPSEGGLTTDSVKILETNFSTNFGNNPPQSTVPFDRQYNINLPSDYDSSNGILVLRIGFWNGGSGRVNFDAFGMYLQ